MHEAVFDRDQRFHICGDRAFLRGLLNHSKVSLHLHVFQPVQKQGVGSSGGALWDRPIAEL